MKRSHSSHSSSPITPQTTTVPLSLPDHLPPSSLPIIPYHSKIVASLDKNDCCVLTSSTGSGKTTTVPFLIYKEHRLFKEHRLAFHLSIGRERHAFKHILTQPSTANLLHQQTKSNLHPTPSCRLHLRSLLRFLPLFRPPRHSNRLQHPLRQPHDPPNCNLLPDGLHASPFILEFLWEVIPGVWMYYY